MSTGVAELLDRFDEPRAEEAGESMMDFARRAFPIPRSLTGDGVRQTLGILQERLPELEIHEVPSGEEVLDWTVPREWSVRAAWLRDPRGDVVADWAENNLHLLGYSVPVEGTFPLDELQQHLHSLPDQPELVPYRTSYYVERWGFCLPHRVRESLPEGDYEVFIDSSLEDGSLTYGELFLPGCTDSEVLLSAHCCHPSLANDNLSGLAVLCHLAGELAELSADERRYGYRFVFAPGTIGAIVWLANHPETWARIRHGLVAANLGDAGGFHYKRSRGGTLEGGEGWPVDAAVAAAAERIGVPLEVEDFVPFGYDERQYCSPGFDLPVGSLTRTPWGRYPEYHTSADDLDLIDGGQLAGSLRLYLAVCSELEDLRRLRNVLPDAEPQLGRRGLYRTLGGDDGGRERELAMLWVLSLADGRRSLARIAERAGLAKEHVERAAAALLEADVLEELE